MTWDDGVLLSTNGDVAERVSYKKGQLIVGRFLQVRGDHGDRVWKLDHVFTLSSAGAGAAIALVTDHLLRGHSFAREVSLERTRQHLAFPSEERGLPNGTGGAGRATFEEIARLACDRAQREGRLTRAHIFEEESAEVLNATDPVKLREELLQVAAVCAGWVEDIDRGLAAAAEPRGLPAPADEEAA